MDAKLNREINPKKMITLYLLLSITHSFTIDNNRLVWLHSFESDYTIEDLELAVNASSNMKDIKKIGNSIIATYESPERIYSGLKYPFFTQSKINGKAVFKLTENGYSVSTTGIKYTQPELDIIDDPLENVALKKGKYRKQFLKFIQGYDQALTNLFEL